MSAQFAHWSTAAAAAPRSPNTLSHAASSVEQRDIAIHRASSRQPDIAIHKASIDAGSAGLAASTGTASYPPLRSHQHRDSVSTTASDSSGSSPTTTASLLDSLSVGETPSHSPDTPASIQSLGYAPLSEKLHPTTFADAHPPPNFADLTRPLPQARKPRNLKNLAVNTQGTPGAGRLLPTSTLPVQTFADAMSTHLVPATPSFVKPPTPRRKGSGLGLSISTNATLLSSRRREPDAIPPTPSLVRPASLRHFPSSPSLNLLTSRAGPDGGMRLPPISTRNHVAVGFADVPLEHEEDEEQNFDLPQSREDNPEAYPDGPICIYDPHVYLYYEPSAAQALSYDVVFNVASEVLNPLSIPAKDLAAAEADSRSTAPDDSVRTEYIHIPWEHNTDIVPDLYRLVKIVDERVQQGKKVLIHCQCGVSRSASLIVAYGLYKNPSITVQEAYDAVKRRSKWIGPNMSLIMQLQEFRSGLLRTSAGVTKSVSKISLARPSFNRSQSAQGEQFVRSHSRMPMSAPLPPEVTDLLAPASAAVAGTTPSVDAGPSSAPSGLRWPLQPDTPQQPTTPAPAAAQELHPASLAQTNQLTVPAHGKSGLAVSNSKSESSPASELQLNTSAPFFAASTSSIGSKEINTKPRLSLRVGPDSLHHSSTFSPTSAELALSSINAFNISSPGNARFATTNLAVISPPTKKRVEAPLSRVDNSSLPPPPPLRPAPRPHDQNLPKLKPILPRVEDGAASLQTSQARAELGARLGMTRRSNYDLRAAFLSGTSKDADEVPALPNLTLTTSAFPQRPKLRTAPSLPDFAESLMSPRESEFTRNPWHHHPRAEAPGESRQWTKQAPGKPLPTDLPLPFSNAGPPQHLKPDANDPRSPVQKGSSPIVRSIFDVL